MGSRWGRTGREEGDSGVGEPEEAGDAWNTGSIDDRGWGRWGIQCAFPLAGPRICTLKVCVRGRFRGPRTD